ncbi:hypothetical protein ENCLCP370B_24130 [Enterobacter cloacae]
MMSLWDALRMNMMISYQELVRTFLKSAGNFCLVSSSGPMIQESKNNLNAILIYLCTDYQSW